MIVFWQSLIAPYIESARPPSILLAGAGDGTLVTRLVEACSAWNGIVHVADRAPAFDVAAMRRLAGDRIMIHKAESADVIGLMPVPNLLLLDIDPNWYTAHRLLRAASDQAKRLNKPFPVTLLANTGWPYARRDGYTDPNAIPEPYRHHHERAGLRPGEPGLCAGFGLFGDRYNAAAENEPRTGVLTALEDFLAGESPRLETAALPFMHGISLIYPQDDAGAPPLRAMLDAMHMGPAAQAMAEASELGRLDVAASHADLLRASQAAQYRNDALHAALRDLQRTAAPAPGAPAAALPDAPGSTIPTAAMPTAQEGADGDAQGRLAAVLHRARRAGHLALWAATFQLAKRRAEEASRIATEAAIGRLRASPVMNAAWYRTAYQDVAVSHEDPAAHYYHHGAAEGRDPGPDFSTAFYCSQYSDVADAGINPLLHYLTDGAREGRNPGPHFDSAFYLENARDVADAGHNPLEHYVACGRSEGRLARPPA